MWHTLKNEQPSGITTMKSSHNLAVHPNPATSMVTIELTGIDGDATLTVTDITGRVLTQKIIPSGDRSCTFDISSLSAGLYFVTAKNGEEQLTGKLIKR